MTSRPRTGLGVLAWICLGAMAILFLNVARSLPQISDILMTGDGDDLMRLQQVRDLLAGQSWFDTQQYRILPPEGISIHWSRYVDVGIAAFLIPASWVLPAAQAELAAIIMWPTLLGCLAILLIGFGNNRLMGPVAAIGALATFLTWGKLGGEFAAGRIDHHNIQILGATAAFYLSLLPGRPWRMGALAGLATAFTLSIGLEMLPMLALLWGMVVLRHAFAEDGVDGWLIGFCLAFAVAAPLLLAGQTAPSQWWVAHCDVLATPVLTLATVGIAATLAQVLAGRALRHPLLRLLVSVVVGGVALWLAAPLLTPCLAGPYAQASAEVRLIIETQVNEALPAWTLIQSRPELLLRVILPPVVITLLALGAAWLMRGRMSPRLRIALAQSVVVVLVGLGFALIQIRAANLMTPAVPLLGGFLVYAFAMIPRDHRLRAPAALALVLAVPATVEAAGRALVGPPELPSQTAAGPTGLGMPGAISVAYCRNPTAMAEIASLPRSIIFASLNIGPAILVYTPQSTTSAGYHRSAAAYWNGVGAFQGRKELRDALAASGADYLVICVGAGEERVIQKLQTGDWPDWLVDVTEDRQTIRAYRVDKAALAADLARE